MTTEPLETMAARLQAASYVTVLTGAGISTDSGIPDFRGPNGIWTKNPGAERLFDLHHYMNDPDIRVQAWRARRSSPAWTARPGAGHTALVELERRGKLDTLITQNIDGLHQMAGSSPERLIEIHGTMREVVCMSCGDRGSMQRVIERLDAGETDPPCRSCGGILKSATISLGQNLIEEDLRRSERAAGHADVFLAIGTSLVVHPVAMLPQVALGRGAALFIINAEPTPYDSRAEAVVSEPLGTALPALVDLV